MYRCTDCERNFENYAVLGETHGMSGQPYEKIIVCPYCCSSAVEQIKANFCRCCGVRLKQRQKEYCSKQCRIRGFKLWQLEARRKRSLLASPINILIKELEQFNKLHKTRYSYGQYVGLIRPRLIGEEAALCL